MDDAGIARAVQMMTMTTRLELGTEGSASVEMVVKDLQTTKLKVKLVTFGTKKEKLQFCFEIDVTLHSA